MRGATAHDWPVGNTCGRCAVGALDGAPPTSCAARVWHRAEILGLGTSGRAIAALHLVASRPSRCPIAAKSLISFNLTEEQ